MPNYDLLANTSVRWDILLDSSDIPELLDNTEAFGKDQALRIFVLNDFAYVPDGVPPCPLSEEDIIRVKINEYSVTTLINVDLRHIMTTSIALGEDIPDVLELLRSCRITWRTFQIAREWLLENIDSIPRVPWDEEPTVPYRSADECRRLASRVREPKRDEFV